VWADLQKLTLDYVLNNDNLDTTIRLIVNATNLRELDLSTRIGSDPNKSAKLIEEVSWAGSKLEVLRLSNVPVTEETLSRWLFRIRHTLTELSLEHVHIRVDTSNCMSMFVHMQQHLPLLQKLNICYLYVGPYVGQPGFLPRWNIKFMFDPGELKVVGIEDGDRELIYRPDAPWPSGIRYRGARVSELLGLLARSSTI